jgi:hypothetical protein
MPSAVKRQNFLRLNKGLLAFFSFSLSLLSFRFDVKRAMIFPVSLNVFQIVYVQHQLRTHAASSCKETGQPDPDPRHHAANSFSLLRKRHGG